jgi:hypothetical protein
MGKKQNDKIVEKVKKKKVDYIMKYVINGYRYTFEKVYNDNGVFYGYCGKSKMWAWLYDDHIAMYAKDKGIMPARKLEGPIRVEK